MGRKELPPTILDRVAKLTLQATTPEDEHKLAALFRHSCRHLKEPPGAPFRAVLDFVPAGYDARWQSAEDTCPLG